MQTIQTNPQHFVFPANQSDIATPAHSLDEFRLVQGNYKGSFSKRSMRPLLTAGLVVASLAGLAIGVSFYSDHNAVKSSAPTTTPDRSAFFGPSTSPGTEASPQSPVLKSADTPEASAPTLKVEAPAAAVAASVDVKKVTPRAAVRSAPVAEKRAVTKPAPVA
ncbi:MAG: hypothetical protein ABL931_04060, partial [Usitatibacteraceae bacterium]